MFTKWGPTQSTFNQGIEFITKPKPWDPMLYYFLIIKVLVRDFHLHHYQNNTFTKNSANLITLHLYDKNISYYKNKSKDKSKNIF